MTFFLVATKENCRPLQKFVLQHHWKLCAKIPPYMHCKSPRQQAVWKLLSEISRTAPEQLCSDFFSEQHLVLEDCSLPLIFLCKPLEPASHKSGLRVATKIPRVGRHASRRGFFTVPFSMVRFSIVPFSKLFLYKRGLHYNTRWILWPFW